MQESDGVYMFLSSRFLRFFKSSPSAVAYAETKAAEAPKKTAAVMETARTLEDEDSLVTLELKNGSKLIVTIVSETPDMLMLDNPLGTMRVSMPRSKIKNIRKPTDKELAKLRKQVAAGKPQDY